MYSCHQKKEKAAADEATSAKAVASDERKRKLSTNKTDDVSHSSGENLVPSLDQGVRSNQLNGAILNSTDSELQKVETLKEPNLWQRVRGNNALMLDVISRVMFPASFLLFNLIYWPYYSRA